MPWQQERQTGAETEAPVRHERKSSTYGSAHFAIEEELAPYMLDALRERWYAEDTGESYLVIGYHRNKAYGLDEQQQESGVLLVAPTGAGKTSRIIAPGLLRERGNRSVFAIDPKQELERLTAGALARHHQVQVFAPTEPRRSFTYNPLAYIHSPEDAHDLAHCLLTNTGDADTTFWDNSAELILTAAILHLVETSPTLPPFSSLFHFLNDEQLPEQLMHSRSPNTRSIASGFLRYLRRTDNTEANVMSGLLNRFHSLQTPTIEAVTSSNEIDFNLMIDQPTALFLSIPDIDAHRLKPLSACFLMQMFHTWVRRANASPGGRLPRGMVCYLDEFANAGRVPKFEHYVSMCRSRRIALILAIQNFSQLVALYGREHLHTIQTNATTHIVLPGVGLEEAEYYSLRMGQATVYGEQISENTITANKSLFGTPTSTGRSYGEAGRPLLYAHDISTLPPNDLLMLVNREPPFLLRSLPYFEDREIKHLANQAYLPPHRIRPGTIVIEAGVPDSTTRPQEPPTPQPSVQPTNMRTQQPPTAQPSIQPSSAKAQELPAAQPPVQPSTMRAQEPPAAQPPVQPSNAKAQEPPVAQPSIQRDDTKAQAAKSLKERKQAREQRLRQQQSTQPPEQSPISPPLPMKEPPAPRKLRLGPDE